MRFLFACIIIVTTPALATNVSIQNELQNMAASIRLAEQQSSKIDKKLQELQIEKNILENNLKKYAHETAKQLHAYHIVKKSPARLSFLHADKSFLDHYYHLRSQESKRDILVHNLSYYNKKIVSLSDKKIQIQDNLREKDDLKLAIKSLLNQIKSKTKQGKIENFQNEIETLKSRHNNLNTFLSDLIDAKNLNYKSSKYPIFSMPLSGVIKQKNEQIEITAPYNALVTTPSAGRIIYADDFKNLGKIVIIDHGYGYISILRGFKDLLVESGYILNNGDPIGIIGGDEWHKGKNSAILYYDLRYNNDSINPIDKITGL